MAWELIYFFMLNSISLFGCITVCLSSHLLRASWLLPCFGNYEENCYQALDDFEITQERRDGSIFTLGLLEYTYMICSHFHVSSSIASYPSAGTASRNACTTHCTSSPSIMAQRCWATRHLPVCAVHHLVPKMCGWWRRNKVWKVWSQRPVCENFIRCMTLYAEDLVLINT